jgi:hypothetical protein
MGDGFVKALLVRPGYDSVSIYLFGWAGEIKNLLIDNEHFLIECALDRATRDRVTELLEKHRDIKLIIFYDHGSKNRLIGHKGETIFSVENINLLQGKIVYVVACSSSEILGPLAVKEGASCYLGYERAFGFFSDSSEVHFQRCANVGIVEILKNKHSVQRIKDAIHEEYNRWIGYYLYGKGRRNPNALFIATRLRLNRDNLTIHGDLAVCAG